MLSGCLACLSVVRRAQRLMCLVSDTDLLMVRRRAVIITYRVLEPNTRTKCNKVQQFPKGKFREKPRSIINNGAYIASYISHVTLCAVSGLSDERNLLITSQKEVFSYLAVRRELAHVLRKTELFLLRNDIRLVIDDCVRFHVPWKLPSAEYFLRQDSITPDSQEPRSIIDINSVDTSTINHGVRRWGVRTPHYDLLSGNVLF
ncbi:hypothetical protein J6590_028330 [Homalodisca vitripennis]|nr:hypothetical protein J6590_028330 [Homalodisca vitripennis]